MTSTPPDQHCFREDGCADHGPTTDDNPTCCCCGWLAPTHSGCDCSDARTTSPAPTANGAS